MTQAQTMLELDDLPMFWQGRANALSISASKRGQYGEATLMEAKVYEECARELRAALRATTAAAQPETELLRGKVNILEGQLRAAMVEREPLENRRDGIGEWIKEFAPYIAADQKHLDENTPERAYWHYGYRAALVDVLNLPTATPSPLPAPGEVAGGGEVDPKAKDGWGTNDLFAYIPSIVENAMLTMWNYICDDSKCHPLDIEHGKGKYLIFKPGHWAKFTGEMVERNIRDLFKPQQS